MNTTAASHLSPAFPGRAPWGTATKLREWQQEALERYLRSTPRDFLAVATPGAGKTTFALRVAAELRQRGVITAITVVAPTEHLKRQWADAAHRAGLAIDPDFRNAHGAMSSAFTGVAVTYAQVAAHALLHRRRTDARPTLVVLDEIHHAGDSLSWGDAVREAFEPATRRLALTGTPFRSDVNPIPFITYEAGGDGIRRSAADYTYGYGQALRDHVVRPVIFMVYGGEMRWRSSAGDEIAASLGDPMTRDIGGQAWRTALDPHGNWIPQVLAAADRRLTEVRRHMPDAGGMVVASDHRCARAYAARLRAITGEVPVVVLSDDPGASARIDEFTKSQQRWLVAVRMVSEGVDVPRLAVGVYATSVSTPLYFAQAVGRFVRARRRGETASVFLPSIPSLLSFASDLEIERDHALDRMPGESDPDTEWQAASRRRSEAAQPERLGFEPLAAEATFDGVLFDGGEFGSRAETGSAEELDFIGLPGLLEPAQVTQLLQRRQAAQLASKRHASNQLARPSEPLPAYRQLRELRKELNGLVGAWHHRTGQPHALIHAELRRACGGPPLPQATIEQVASRIERLRAWAERV